MIKLLHEERLLHGREVLGFEAGEVGVAWELTRLYLKMFNENEPYQRKEVNTMRTGNAAIMQLHSRATPKAGVPFGIHFAERAENQTTLRKGLEMYDDPTTADTTGDHEDPHTDSD